MGELDVLMLRLDAPMVSFGAARIDKNGVVQALPGRAMLTGLVGNALGWEHRDAARLQSLQGRITYAVRQDVAGEALLDYHTVDLGQPFMLEGWTTRGAPEGREGGESKTGTLIRYQHYRADAVYTVALALREGEGPTLDDVEKALRSPERPLFFGRKCCLPSGRIVQGRARAASLREALRAFPCVTRGGARRETKADEKCTTWWPVREGTEIGRTIELTDDMDWSNQVHVGRRAMQEASVSYAKAVAS